MLGQFASRQTVCSSGFLDYLLQILVVRAGTGGGTDPAGFAFDRGLGVLGLDAEQSTSIRMYSGHPGDDTC